MTMKVSPSFSAPLKAYSLLKLTPRHCLDLDIVRVGDADTCGTYVFEVKHLPRDSQFREAVFFARQHLLEEATKYNYNVLLLER